MNPDTDIQRFLLDRHPGYRDLTAEERDALNDFCLIWPVFEGSILGPTYTSKDLLAVPETLSAMGVLQVDTLAQEIAYLKGRYWQNGAPTPMFDGLRIDRTTKHNQKVIQDFVSSGPELPVVDAIQGVLMILLRYRNNTFHGAKSLYGYRDQLSNFRVACAVLMFVLAHHPLRY